MNYIFPTSLIMCLVSSFSLAYSETVEGAGDIIKFSMAATAKLPSYSLKFDINETSINPKMKVSIFCRNDFDLHMDITGAERTTKIYCNKKETWIYDSRQGKYRGLGIPKSRHDVILANIEKPLGYLTEWLSLYLHNRQEVLDNANTSWLMPDGELDGKRCHKIKLTYGDYDIYAYFSMDNKYLLSRIEMNLGKQYQTISGKRDDIILSTDGLEWGTAFPLNDSLFTITVTDENIVTNKKNELTRGSEVYDMTFSMLDGSETHISQHFGKQVIVLLFWASWCGPCRKALPLASTVLNDFPKTDIVSYFINVNESHETIRAFCTKYNINDNIVLDYGKIRDSFEEDGIPSVFVIGKDRRIKEIFEGYSPSYETDLRKILALLTS